MGYQYKIHLLITGLILIVSTGFCQEKMINKAEADFAKLQFNLAREKYSKAAAKAEKDSYPYQYAKFKAAECYRLMNLVDSAECIYEELVKSGFGNKNNEIYLVYANALRMKGDVDRAREYYSLFLKNDRKDPVAALGLKSCDWIRQNSENRARAKILILPGLNSIWDDFVPAFADSACNELLFTSNREGTYGKLTDQWTGSGFSDLFVSGKSSGKWSTPYLFDISGLVNTEIHEGTPAFNSDRTSLYFTRCERIGEIHNRCEVLRSVKKHNTWQEPERVLFDSTANIGQPSVSGDELTIFFSSGWRGGKGGKDLWMATRESKDAVFTNPKNLGNAINTHGDEMFPRIFNDSVLFFASNGHPGYGGLDIFKSVYRNGKWSDPQNLLSPINSGYDDFGLIVEVPGESGYFTSNRPGGQGRDDIYRFVPDPYLFTASGQVKDLMNLLPIPGALVELIDEKELVVSKITDEKGMFHFDSSEVREGRSYRLVAARENYFSDKESFDTRSFIGDRDFSFELVLEPIPEEPIVLPDILFPLDEWTLEPQYKDSLMHLVEILGLNETLVIELRSHTDSRASLPYNDNLSQKRAQAVVDFLISQGIDPGRMVAKGYGERIPRTLNKDVTKDGFDFKAGTLLDDDFVLSLPSRDMQEAAFHLNRRTEFAVIAKDFKAGESTSGTVSVIRIISDSTLMEVPFQFTADGKVKIKTHINNYGTDAIIDPDAQNSSIDSRILMELLQKKAIDRTNFRDDFESILVDGSIAENATVVLEKVRMGEKVTGSAVVIVKNNEEGIFIIGSDILDEAGELIIDNDRKLIIFK